MPDRAISHDRRRPSRAGKRSSSHSQNRKRSESADITDRRKRDIEGQERPSRERNWAWEEGERRNRTRFTAHRTGRNARYRYDDKEGELDDDDDDREPYDEGPSSYARARSRRPAQRTGKSRQRRRTRGGSYGMSSDEYDSENAAWIGNQTDDSESALVSKASKTPAFKKPPRAQRPTPLHPRKHESLRHAKAKGSPSPSPVQMNYRMHDRRGTQRRHSHSAGDDEVPEVRNRKVREGSRRRPSRTQPLSSADASLTPETIARFNAENERLEVERQDGEARAARRQSRRRPHHRSQSRESHANGPSNPRRLASGAFLEEGRSGDLSSLRGGLPPGTAGHRISNYFRGNGGGDGPGGGEGGYGRRYSSDGDTDSGGDAVYEEKQKRPNCFSQISQRSTKEKLLAGFLILAILLIIIIPVAVVTGRHSHKENDRKLDNGPGQDDSSYPGDTPYNKDLKNLDHDDIPKTARGTFIDPFTWYDTRDFNLTFTEEMIGGLSVIGLNSSWDDSAQANGHVPALNDTFDYGKTPIRGVSLGGWLSIEPFITPSLFEPYHNMVVDEWTLMKRLGSKSKDTIEKHYATFVQEDTFREIQDAGFDHVRIPFSYWAVKTYDGDEYLPHVSWRYLLRGIEWARKYGLRILLDLHGIPGSQNGWNHSGRQGTIGWLNGTHGDRNAQRGIDIHDQLSKFFAQDRYKNVIGIYGLANEPFMINLNVSEVINWNDKAVKTIRDNGFKQWITFGDGFLKLTRWKTMMQNVDDRLMLDTHQYTIFNLGQIGMSHEAKLKQVCSDDDGGWIKMLGDSNSHEHG